VATLARMKGWTQRLLGSRPQAAGRREPVPLAAVEPVRLVAATEPEPFRGHIEAIGATHAEGWTQSLRDPSAHVPFAAVLPGSQKVLARGVANQFGHGMHAAGIGDGTHGFVIRFDPPLDEAQQAQLEIRLPSGAALPRAENLRTTFEPILHVAMDIVDNCNLRCPFCLYDYANVHATHFMTEETIDAALRLLPYTRDGEFWFSCLHEPTLHPKLTQFIDKVPRTLRRKLFYTTNLAKRMPQKYFEWFVDNEMHHVNISIESMQPELYERMRKGARHRIFMENWDILLRALDQGTTPPRLRYITMVYKSNLHELPELVRYLLEERRAWQVELRHTFDVPHLPDGFRESEFLDWDQWLWLRDQMAQYPADRVQLSLPPPPAPSLSVPAAVPVAAAAPSAPAGFLPHRYLFRMSWDGSLRVVGILSDSRNDDGREKLMLETNVREIEPLVFLDSLALNLG
jgi:sulfatase maturation enzyme AslB (radical SAM superfamily)